MRAAYALPFLIVLAAPLAEAQQPPRPPQAACDRAKLPGRSYIECLEAALRDSDRALNETIARIRALIDARTELAAVQKTRWKNALEEAQGMYLRFRGFECQNVAPYEGAKGIGAFEERLACLVDKNVARTRDLEARYGR
jgi:uncharacterized protein YecT (DUF1311 family)